MTRIFCQRPKYDLLQFPAQSGAEPAGRRGGLLQMAKQDSRSVLTGKWCSPGQHSIKVHTQAVYSRTRVNRLSGALFRGNVVRSPDDRILVGDTSHSLIAVFQLRDAEIEHKHPLRSLAC